MGFDGYLEFGGTEIINRARLNSYISTYAPGAITACACDCDDLNIALGDEVYSGPAQDNAPWYDPDRPESAKFLGMLPLAIEGLEGSTRDTTFIERIDDGGAITGRRSSSREVRVRGVLCAVNEAGLYAGKVWLERMLDGSCEADCGDGDRLCFFTACPDTSGVGELVAEPVPLASLMGVDHGSWNGGTFNSPEHTLGVHGHSAAPRLEFPTLTAPLPCDTVMWYVTLTSPDGPRNVLARVKTDKGVTGSTVVEVGPQPVTISFGDPGMAEQFIRPSIQFAGDGESPVIAEGSLRVTRVEVAYRRPVDPARCADPLFRQLRNVHCIEGPRVIREYNTQRAWYAEVEFTLAAMTPWRYTDEFLVAAHKVGELEPTFPGAVVRRSPRTLRECNERNLVRYIVDPDCPQPPKPPIAKPPASSCSDPTTPVKTWLVSIPETAVPAWADAVPVIRLSTGAAPVRRCRIRFVSTIFPTDPAVENLDPCRVCGEFVVDYIPKNSTFVIDGMREIAYLELPGGATSSAGHLLSGPTPDTLFSWPLLSCGIGYVAVLDVQDTDIVDVSLSLAHRE